MQGAGNSEHSLKGPRAFPPRPPVLLLIGLNFCEKLDSYRARPCKQNSPTPHPNPIPTHGSLTLSMAGGNYINLNQMGERAFARRKKHIFIQSMWRVSKHVFHADIMCDAGSECGASDVLSEGTILRQSWIKLTLSNNPSHPLRPGCFGLARVSHKSKLWLIISV